jgi:ribosomal protein S27AE
VFKKLRDDPISVEAVYKIQKLLRDKGYYMLDGYQLERTGKPDPRCGNKELLAEYKNSKLLHSGGVWSRGICSERSREICLRN